MTADGILLRVPQMGMAVAEGMVTAWLKSEGDSVAQGEPVCELETDKATVQVEAPSAGRLARILVAVGARAAVGAPLAEIRSAAAGATGMTVRAPPDEPIVETSSLEQATPAASRAPVLERATISPPAFVPSGEKFDPDAAAWAAVSVKRRDGLPPVSPLARRMAVELGVDLRSMRGTGLGGRIRRDDVLAARAGAPAQPEVAVPPGYADVPREVLPTSPIRRAIAEHMVRSRHTAAHMTTEVDVDMGHLLGLRETFNRERQGRGAPGVTPMAFVARAAVSMLRQFPDLNATFAGEWLIRWREINLCIAVDTPDGLLAPVIPSCDRLTLLELADAIRETALRARARRLQPADLRGGTFTISNPGSVGAVSAPAIINQPQVAILGLPLIVKRPVVVAGPGGVDAIAIRPIVRLAVTYDHRALDGADATRFAVRVKECLEGWSTAEYLSPTA